MPGRLVLLITSLKGKEDRAEEEVGNTLFHLDPEIRIVKTKYPGVLLVYSDKLDPSRAYRGLKSRYQAFVRKKVPVLKTVKGWRNCSEIAEAVIETLREKKWSSIRVDCTFRGPLKCSCTRIADRIANELGITISYRRYEARVFIETLDDLLIIGYVPI